MIGYYLLLYLPQEVESRLLVVTKDVSALRGTLAAVTSKAEAAAATSQALQEELTRVSEDMHRTAGQVAALRNDVSVKPEYVVTVLLFTDCVTRECSTSDTVLNIY